ncbi:MAG: DUF4288 domain-containing protein [Planctomycetota bacterium]|jgi:hypothetical protein
MNWYSTRLLYRCLIDGEPDSSGTPYETCIYLIKAKDRDDAQAKSETRGKKEARSFKDKSGRKVSWEFDSILQLQQLDEGKIEDGIEIFSRYHMTRPEM